jgi:glycosyltransferase involved in cell wall biosynthesis
LETFGRVLVEAMSARLPVITTDAPGCRDVITDQVTGLLSKPDDVELMALNIQKMLQDEELRISIIERAFSYCQKYDWNVVVTQYENVYYRAISERKLMAGN